MRREFEIRKKYGLDCNIPLGSVELSIFDRVRKNWKFKLSLLRANLKETNVLFLKRIGLSIEELIKEINELNTIINETKDHAIRSSLKDLKESVHDILIYKRLMKEYNTIYSKFKPAQDIVSLPYPRESRMWE